MDRFIKKLSRKHKKQRRRQILIAFQAIKDYLDKQVEGQNKISLRILFSEKNIIASRLFAIKYSSYLKVKLNLSELETHQDNVYFIMDFDLTKLSNS